MTKRFEKGNYKSFKTAVENKKAALIICKTDKTSFGLLIVDPIIFNDQWSSSSLISAFNILDRKEFRGKGKVVGYDWGKGGLVQIGGSEVVIQVNGNGRYEAYSYSGGGILQITKDHDGINAITKERGSKTAKLKMLEVYA